MGQLNKRSFSLWCLVKTVVIAGLICWAAYITWSVVRLNNKNGTSATHRAFIEEELSDRDLARALGVRAWKFSVLPDENRKHLTGVQLHIVDTGTNVQTIIATSPFFKPTEVQHIQVFLVPIPLGTDLSNAEEIEIVFSFENGRLRKRIRNPFYGSSTAVPALPADFAEDLELMTTIEFANPEDIGKNIGKLSSIKLMISFFAK